MQTTRWKIGDRVAFFAGGEGIVFGTVREVTELAPARDDLYSVEWDDGFEDGEGNVFPEWELSDPEEIDAESIA